MYNRYLILSSVAAIAALHCPMECQNECRVEWDENVFAKLKGDPTLFKALFNEGFIAEEGEDSDLRPRYVGTQAAFEHHFTQGLAIGMLKRVIAVIHTPLPATPVCSAGEISPGLVDPSMIQDEKRLQTVYERPSVIRSLLQAGGTVMVAYPAVAREQRSEAQLAIFDGLLEKYPENLLDVPMGCLEIAPEMAGATYLFETAEGQWLTYSIRFTQAAAPTEPCKAAMWLGGTEEGPAAERLAQVSAYLQACQGPNLTSFISN